MHQAHKTYSLRYAQNPKLLSPKSMHKLCLLRVKPHESPGMTSTYMVVAKCAPITPNRQTLT